MPESQPLRRRTLLKGGVLAALGSVSRPENEQVSRTVQYYANERGYVDANGLLNAVGDWRRDIIDSNLLFEVANYYRSGEPVVQGDSANPARLIESHIDTLGETAFSLDIQEYQNSTIDSPSKTLNFQWDNATEQSQLTESSRQNRELDVTQLFTQNRQHVDIQQNNTQVNQATLPIDKGPVYIDGRELLDQLLIGASLSFEGLVSVGGTTLSRYSIENHRRLPEASGHVIGDEGAYIAELEVQWELPDGRLTEIDIYTETTVSQSLDSLQSFEPSINSTSSSGSAVRATADHSSVSIAEVSPNTTEALTGGSTETFDLTIDYDMGGASPGEIKISVREESWGDIDKTVSIDQQSGSIETSISEQIKSSWAQAKLIVNLYDSDGFVALDGDELSYTIDGESGGETSQLPDLEVTDLEWSPANPTPSDDIEFRVEIENTGDGRAESIEPRVFVDGELAYVPPTVDLDPGERQWAVETGSKSFNAGEYTARAVVDPEDHIDEQDETNNELERSLTVEVIEEDISAELRNTQVATGTYTTDELVTTDATVENTGNVAHTFFVGYDVVGPAGEHYNNNAQTGQRVDLDPGESADISLDWTVQETAPGGEYDAIISVWEESDRDSLRTRLDSSTESDSFTVNTTDPRPELRVESLDWTPQLPERSAAVTFESAISNIGDGRAAQFVVELAIDGQQIDSKSIDELASNQRQTVTFDSWTATEDSSVTVTVDPNDETRDETDSNNILTQQLSVSQPNPQISITEIQAENSTYAPEDTPTTTTTLTNTSEVAQEVDMTQELRGPDGGVLSTTKSNTVDASESVTVSSQWGPSGSLTTGQYDLTVRVSVDAEVIAETTQSSIFEVTEPTGPVDVDVETVTAQGSSVDGARIILTPIDGGSDLSAVSNGGLAELGSVRPGEYGLTAESTRLNQTLSFGLVVDGTSDLTRQIVFRPTDAVYGTVFNGAEQQQIAEATVSIPELQETTETDVKGEFVLESEIPDGTYEFEITVTPDNTVIADSEVSTFNKTKDVGIDRTVTFDIPIEIQQPENNSSELISEEDRLVGVVVRNLERRDVLLPLEQQFISLYGLVKGIITGTQDFLEEIWELLTNLDDIPEMISAIIKMINLVLDDPSVIFKMVSMMINNIIEKQEQDNPFEEGTLDYHSFFGAWMLGYGGIKIVISVIGTKGVTSASKFVKSSSNISNAVDSLKGRVSNGNLPDYSPINRRIRPCSVTSAQGVSANASNCRNIDTATAVEFMLSNSGIRAQFRETLEIIGEIRRFGNNDNTANLFFEFRDLKDADPNDYRSILSEYLWGNKLRTNLPGNFVDDFGQNIEPKIVKQLETDQAGNPTLPAGDARIILPDQYPGDDIGFEFDAILVGRVPQNRPDAGELKIYEISEVKISEKKTHMDALEQVAISLNKIRTNTDSNGNGLDEDNYAGIPIKKFIDITENDESTIRTVAGSGKRGTNFNDYLQYDFTVLNTMRDYLREYTDTLDMYTR